MNLFFASQESSGGLAAFGLDIKAFVFQVVTFGIVVFFLNKFVLKKLFKIIDARQAEINAGLERAQKAQHELDRAATKVNEIIKNAHVEAEAMLHEAKSEATNIVKTADEKAARQAERIIEEARAQLSVDIEKAKKDLKQENARLVAKISGELIGQRLDSANDAKLISAMLEKN